MSKLNTKLVWSIFFLNFKLTVRNGRTFTQHLSDCAIDRCLYWCQLRGEFKSKSYVFKSIRRRLNVHFFFGRLNTSCRMIQWKGLTMSHTFNGNFLCKWMCECDQIFHMLSGAQSPQNAISVQIETDTLNVHLMNEQIDWNYSCIGRALVCGSAHSILNYLYILFMIKMRSKTNETRFVTQ